MLSKKQNVKPGDMMQAPPAPEMEIDYRTLLSKLKLESVESTAPDAVPMETLKQVADQHAKAIWGVEVARGDPLQLVDTEGEPVLYAFPYAIGIQQFPETDELIKQLHKLWEIGNGSDRKTKTFPKETPFFVRSEIKNYGTIYVSARKRDYPVKQVSHALHPYFYNAERALWQVKGERLIRLHYLPPHEFFEIQKEGSTLFVHTHLMMSEEEIRATARKFRSTPETEDIAVEERAKSYTEQISEAWDAYEQTAQADDEFRIRHWERMPAIYWTLWCEPTSASMVFSYWDHYVPVPGIGTHVGYDRIVDYWFNHPSNESNVPDIIDPIAAEINIDVANIMKGYNWTVDKVFGNPGNDYAWNELTEHLHNHRPCVWHVFGAFAHANAAFGYRILNGQRYIILYTTWSDDPQIALAEWLYNDWTSVEVDRYVPGGKELNRYLFIHHPYGEETYHVGQWIGICFAVHPMTDIRKARIEYSLDGGQSWNLVVEVWVQPGWNQWWWKPTTPSNHARIRIRGMSDNGQYLAGDGSFHDFVIQ